MGSPHLEGFARTHADLLRTMDGCIWEAGYKDEADRPTISLGLKGILSIELRAHTANTDAHPPGPRASGGLYPNAIWRLIDALYTLRASDGTVLVDGFLDPVRPPTAADMALLEQWPFDAEVTDRERRMGMAGLLGGRTGMVAPRRLVFEPTCTINGMVGGYTGPGSKTVIPARAMAKLDFRLVPDLTPELALTLVKAHLARRGFDDVEVVEIEGGLMPARTDPNAAIVASVLGAMAEVYGVDPVIQPSMAGSGPMYQLCQSHGIPAVSLGVGWSQSRVHAPNESVRIADFIQGIKVMGRVYGGFAVR